MTDETAHNMQTQHQAYIQGHAASLDFSHLIIDTSIDGGITARIPSGSTIPDPTSVEEGGRTWQAYKEGAYFLPNDAEEQDRLDMQHSMFKLMLDDRLYAAPLSSDLVDAKVLDVGTGTGIWAIEFAEQHPTYSVIGTDLSQIQPLHAAPPNCEFVREDVEDNWTLDMKFDFIHLRLMFTCFQDAKSVMQKLYDNLKPGGFLEYEDPGYPQIQGFDDSFTGSNLENWVRLFNAGGAALGRDFSPAVNYQDWMLEAGFVDVVEKIVAIPGGAWPVNPKQKKLGRFLNVDWNDVVDGFSMKTLGVGLNMSAEEVKTVTTLVHEDLRNPNIRWFTPVYFVYGRKPYPGERNVALPK